MTSLCRHFLSARSLYYRDQLSRPPTHATESRRKMINDTCHLKLIATVFMDSSVACVVMHTPLHMLIIKSEPLKVASNNAETCSLAWILYNSIKV